MKSENSLLEELTFPPNYMSAYNDILALVARAFDDGVYFQNTFHALLQGDHMLLRMDGITLPLLTAEAIADAKSRLVGDQAEIITDEAALKTILRGFDSRNRALYWYLLWKYGVETTVISTQAGVCLFSTLGENGVYDMKQNPPPLFIDEFHAAAEEIENCDGNCEECDIEEDLEDDEYFP